MGGEAGSGSWLPTGASAEPPPAGAAPLCGVAGAISTSSWCAARAVQLRWSAIACTRRSRAPLAVSPSVRLQEPSRSRCPPGRARMPGIRTPGGRPLRPARHEQKGLCLAVASVMPRARRAACSSVSLSAPAACTAQAAQVRFHCHAWGGSSQSSTAVTCSHSQAASASQAACGALISARIRAAVSRPIEGGAPNWPSSAGGLAACRAPRMPTLRMTAAHESGRGSNEAESSVG